MVLHEVSRETLASTWSKWPIWPLVRLDVYLETFSTESDTVPLNVEYTRKVLGGLIARQMVYMVSSSPETGKLMHAVLNKLAV
jgi:hypothetical protein